MKVTVDDAAPGSGKTFAALNRMISFPAKYLFVTERTRSIRSIASECRHFASQRDRTVAVHPISSDDLPESSISVRVDVERLPGRFKKDGHVIAIISHAALLMSDLTEFRGWNIIIDEIPSVLSIQEVQTYKDTAFFKDYYTLAPLDGFEDWSVVGLTDAGEEMTSRHLSQDDSHRHLRNFHTRVLESSDGDSRNVICNLCDWSEMGEACETDTGKFAPWWIWGSLFTLSALAKFDSVTILGNRFAESLSYKLLVQAAIRDSLDVEWSFIRTTRSMVWQPRDVRVVYFSDRKASRYHLTDDIGREHLALIDDYLAKAMNPNYSLWTTNRDFRANFSHLSANRFQPPKLAGSNEFCGCSDAAIIYSAKASPNVRGLLKAHGVSERDWTSTNELEIILQFLTRTSVRDPLSTATVTMYVYDKSQADYVCHQLSHSPHLNVICEHVDLGITTTQKKRGPKARILSADEIAAKANLKRAQSAAAMRKWRAKLAKGGAA